MDPLEIYFPIKNGDIPASYVGKTQRVHSIKLMPEWTSFVTIPATKPPAGNLSLTWPDNFAWN